MNINDILNAENLGELSDENVFNAFGVTDKGIRVWLPQISKNDYWENVVIDNERFIIQKGLQGKTGRDGDGAWQSAVVLTRDKPDGSYTRLPNVYRPVFCDYNECITIHMQETLPNALVTPPYAGNNIKWFPCFADTAQNARAKADNLIKKAGV